MNCLLTLLTIVYLFTSIHCVSGLSRSRVKRQSTCSKYEWKCEDGQCIDASNVCDGEEHCDDKSDETSNACTQIRCPTYSFRCTYGACVKGTAECDGIKDCADGSDELPILCEGPHELGSEGNCTKFIQFQCDSGECLPVENLCDGKIDCPDESDETIKRCASFYCPTFAFKCDYGACVSGEAKCDKNKDCLDASDESQELCNYPTPITFSSTQRPTRITTKRPVSTTPPPDGSCYTPVIPENGRIVYAHDNNIQLRAGDVIMLGSAIEYKCYSKYALIGEGGDTCIDGQWSYPTPKCRKYCDPIPLNKISITAHCEYQGKTISCIRPIPPKTRVTISCKIGYDKPARSLPDVILCDDSGEWNTHPWKCDQTCGIPSPELIPYIVNGVVTEIRKVPWHVAVYSHVGEEYRYLCGGSIISSKIVLSAAHCFWDGINSRIGEASKYAIAAGKTLNDRNAVEETVPQFFDISQIITKEQYLHEEGLYYHDIAIIILSEYIIFKEYILPVCVDFNLRDSQTYVASGMLGKLSGWGLTESGGSTSEVLRTVELPSVDYTTCVAHSNVSFRKYITSDKFCAGLLDGTSACQGDSGGGLVFNKPENGIDKYYVYGIVSLGPSSKGSCDNTKYSLFTNVNYYINMILDPYFQYLNNV